MGPTARAPPLQGQRCRRAGRAPGRQWAGLGGRLAGGISALIVIPVDAPDSDAPPADRPHCAPRTRGLAGCVGLTPGSPRRRPISRGIMPRWWPPWFRSTQYSHSRGVAVIDVRAEPCRCVFLRAARPLGRAVNVQPRRLTSSPFVAARSRRPGGSDPPCARVGPPAWSPRDRAGSGRPGRLPMSGAPVPSVSTVKGETPAGGSVTRRGDSLRPRYRVRAASWAPAVGLPIRIPGKGSTVPKGAATAIW